MSSDWCMITASYHNCCVDKTTLSLAVQ